MQQLRYTNFCSLDSGNNVIFSALFVWSMLHSATSNRRPLKTRTTGFHANHKRISMATRAGKTSISSLHQSSDGLCGVPGLNSTLFWTGNDCKALHCCISSNSVNSVVLPRWMRRWTSVKMSWSARPFKVLSCRISVEPG